MKLDPKHTRNSLFFFFIERWQPTLFLICSARTLPTQKSGDFCAGLVLCSGVCIILVCSFQVSDVSIFVWLIHREEEINHFFSIPKLVHKKVMNGVNVTFRFSYFLLKPPRFVIISWKMRLSGITTRKRKVINGRTHL